MAKRKEEEGLYLGPRARIVSRKRTTYGGYIGVEEGPDGDREAKWKPYPSEETTWEVTMPHSLTLGLKRSRPEEL